ncbi:MAG: hypothetical protein HQK76_02005 [Desulfobacterales bacterium]|nr:hypothetical protein [Desulfobacterales bacterium]
MSNPSDNQNDSWKPLNLGGLNKIDYEDKNTVKKEIPKPKKTDLDSEIFKSLYEKKKKPADNSFHDFFSKPHKKEKEEVHSLFNEFKSESTDENLEDDPQKINVDVEAIKKEAYDQGFKQGYSEGEQKGFEAGKEKSLKETENLSNLLKQIDDIWKVLISSYEKEILDLILKVCEKVIYAYVEIDNDLIKRSILKAFELIPEPVDVSIHVSPADYEYIEALKQDFFEQIKGLKNVSIMPLPSIERGNCKILTKSGEINSQVQLRLDAIKKSIIEVNLR